MAIVTADLFSLHGKATERPHHVDWDSEAAIAIRGQLTGDNAKAGANNSSIENNRPRGFDHAGDLFGGA